MRNQYEAGVWSQCPGSYWVINSQSWSGTSGHRPDYTWLSDRAEDSMLWHISGHRAG